MTTPKSSRVNAGSKQIGGDPVSKNNFFPPFGPPFGLKLRGGEGARSPTPPLDPPLRVKKGSAASVKTTEQVV